MPLTIEARTDYVTHVTRLSLWLAEELWNSGIPLDTALTANTPIYRLTTLWDGLHHPAEEASDWTDAVWRDLIERIKPLFAKKRMGALSSDSLENDGAAFLLPFLEPRIERDVKAWPWLPSGYCTKVLEENRFGFFLYDTPEETSAPWDLDLHLGNCCAPESPFTDLAARARELRKMLDAIAARQPQARTIGCNSWLNSFAPFLKLFPSEWAKDSPAHSVIGYSYNVWGQLVSRTGGFHHRNASLLRQSRTFPYPARDGRCTLADLSDHLSRTFST